MATRILSALCLIALTGCATCREHPVACWVATGVIAGTIVASGSHRTQALQPIGPGPGCTKQPDGSCR